MSTNALASQPTTSRIPWDQKRALLRRLPGGRIQALSSDGHTVYDVTLSPVFCTCPAGRRSLHCYHVLTAAERYAGDALPACIAVAPASYAEPVRELPPNVIPFRPRQPEAPEPPPPAAPAVRRACPCELYGPDACKGHCTRQVREAAATYDPRPDGWKVIRLPAAVAEGASFERPQASRPGFVYACDGASNHSRKAGSYRPAA